jgi:methylenetetrahydrofolate dehydrogenase (NADP+)/methenyltetrahydrofolate cyclohydrolase
MQTKIIEGKELSSEILSVLKQDIESKKLKPALKIISVGNDPASKVYIRKKKKLGESIGIKVSLVELSEKTSTKELTKRVGQVNNDKSVHGLIVQLPLPKGIKEKELLQKISPEKDVDGMSPVSLGNLWQGNKAFAAATPLSIMRCLESTGVALEGKHAVIINRSNIIGKPLTALLLQENATVTICHSKTSDLKKHTNEADIVISATGKTGLITGDHIKKGAIVIDAGINKTALGIAGDVDEKSVTGEASFLTPVPGGVGPMTVAMLMKNTVEACMNLTLKKSQKSTFI